MKKSFSERHSFTFSNGFSVEWNDAGLAMIVNAERLFVVAIPPNEFKVFIKQASETMKDNE